MPRGAVGFFESDFDLGRKNFHFAPRGIYLACEVHVQGKAVDEVKEDGEREARGAERHLTLLGVHLLGVDGKSHGRALLEKVIATECLFLLGGIFNEDARTLGAPRKAYKLGEFSGLLPFAAGPELVAFVEHRPPRMIGTYLLEGGLVDVGLRAATVLALRARCYVVWIVGLVAQLRCPVCILKKSEP